MEDVRDLLVIDWNSLCRPVAQ